MVQQIKENIRLNLPVYLILTLIVSVFWGGWNLATLKISIDNRLSAIEEKLEELDNNKKNTITMAHARLWCFRTEVENPGFVCPSIDKVREDLGIGG